MRRFSVRPITSDDTAGLVNVWRRTWAETYGNTLGQKAVEIMRSGLDMHGITQMMPGNGERGFCVLDGNEIVGSAIYITRGAIAYLWGMYVLPSHQHLGIGGMLLQTVIQSVGNDVQLEVRVQLSSPHAKSFYTHYGFQVQGRETLDMFNGLMSEVEVMSRNTENIACP